MNEYEDKQLAMLEIIERENKRYERRKREVQEMSDNQLRDLIKNNEII